jgi:hypothetical protein
MRLKEGLTELKRRAGGGKQNYQESKNMICKLVPFVVIHK